MCDRLEGRVGLVAGRGMDTTAVPVPNPAEVDSIVWVTPAEMARLPGLLQSNQVFLEHWEGFRDLGI